MLPIFFLNRMEVKQVRSFWITFLISFFSFSMVFSQDWRWVKAAGGNNEDLGAAIAVDAAKNTYVTGYFLNNAQFGASNLTNAGNRDIFIAKYNANGQVVWAQRAGGSGIDEGRGIALDGSGNVYIAGYFNGTASFNTSPAAVNVTSAGGQDIFIAKYSNAGALEWVKRFGSTLNDEAFAITASTGGEVLFTGMFRGTVAFGGTNLISAGTSSIDMVLAKMDASGNVFWAQKGGGAGSDYGRAIAIDATGNAYITGDFSSSAVFGSVTLTGESSSQDAFFAKYDASGVLQWAKRGGGAFPDFGTGIQADAAGNVYTTGYFGGNSTFGTLSVTHGANYDAFIVKFDGNGNALWVKKGGGAGTDYGKAICTDAAGNSYVTGYYEATATFGGTPLSNAGTTDIFVAYYNSGGDLVAVKGAGGTGGDQGNGVAIDQAGEAYVTGIFRGPATFSSTILQSNTNTVDLFVAKFGTTGCVNPVMETQPAPVNGCEAGQAQFKATAKGQGTFTYQWKRGNVNVGTNDSVLLLSNLTLADAGNYSCTITDDCGTVISNAAALSINQFPVISTQPASRKVCAGAQINLSVAASGSFPLTYQWKKDGNPVGTNASSITISTGSAANFGKYTCTVSNNCGQIVSDTALVEAIPANICSTDWSWAKRAGGTVFDYGFGITTDQHFNIYVTGSYGPNTASFGNNINLTASAGDNVFLAKFDSLGNAIWAQKGAGIENERARKVVTDKWGNVYITGYFGGTATFGSTNLVSAGGFDVFVAKYDKNGTLKWIQKAGGNSADEGRGLGLDSLGNVFVSGYFMGTASFGGLSVTTAGGQDAFLAKYDSIGNIQWVKAGGGAGSDISNGLAADDAGNTIISGEFAGTATFGSASVTNAQPAAFLAKYDDAGNLLWLKKAHAAVNMKILASAVDGSGNSFHTGSFEGTGQWGTHSLASAGLTDMFVAKYNAAGEALWVQKGGGANHDGGVDIAVDPTGFCYVTGNHGNEATFGGVSVSSGLSGMFLAQYDTDGKFIFTKGTVSVFGSGMGIDGIGRSYVTGYFTGTVGFGNTNLTSQGSSGTDIFFARMPTTNCLPPTITGYSQTQLGNDSVVIITGTSLFGATSVLFNNLPAASFVVNSSTQITAILPAGNTQGKISITARCGQVTSAMDFVSGPITFVSGFTPAYAKVGDTVYIKGVNFAGATAVYFNQVPAASFNVLADTLIAVVVPAGANGQIRVTTSLGTGTSTADFTLVIPPTPQTNWVWAKKAGGINGQIGSGIAVDASGNSYVTGDFFGTIEIGNIAEGAAAVLSGAAAVDIFIAKYNAAGEVLWSKQAGGSWLDKGLAIAADPGGNSYVGGFFRGVTESPGSTPAIFGNLILNGDGGFVAKYNTSGDALWVKKIGEKVNAVAADDKGNIYVTGTFNGTETLDGHTISASATAPDIFIARFNQNGQCLWLKQGGSSAQTNGFTDKGLGISFDETGNVYVAGEAGDGASFGAFTLLARGGFVAKYNPDGQVLWAKTAGANGVNGIVSDKAGNIMITGKTNRPAVFDTITVPNFNYAGAYEGPLFVARYNTNGHALWVKMAGFYNGKDFEDSKAIDMDEQGNAYITGHYRWDSTYFDSIRINGRGWEDLFVAKYDTLGQVQWVTDAGSDGAEFSRGIAVDAVGTCYITGSMSSENQPVRFGTILPPIVTQQEDVFVARLGTNGCSTPGIISFNPFSAATGDTVYVKGVNFTGVSEVTFNNIAAAYFVVDSAKGLRAVVPGGNATGKIKLVTPCGTATSATNLGVMVTYIFTGNGDWNNAANWNNNQVPAANDLVVIPAGKTVLVGGYSAAAKSVTIQPGGSLTVQVGGSLTVGALENKGSINVLGQLNINE